MTDDAGTKRERQMVMVVHKYKLGEEPSDLDYWLQQPYEARLAALEELRRELYGPDYDAQSGFPRVYRIVKRK